MAKTLGSDRRLSNASGCKLRIVALQFAIGDVLGLGRIVAFPDDRRLVGASGEVPVDAVCRHVQDAIVVPADMDVAGVVDDRGDVLNRLRKPVRQEALVASLLDLDEVGKLERPLE